MFAELSRIIGVIYTDRIIRTYYQAHGFYFISVFGWLNGVFRAVNLFFDTLSAFLEILLDLFASIILVKELCWKGQLLRIYRIHQTVVVRYGSY